MKAPKRSLAQVPSQDCSLNMCFQQSNGIFSGILFCLSKSLEVAIDLLVAMLVWADVRHSNSMHANYLRISVRRCDACEILLHVNGCLLPHCSHYSAIQLQCTKLACAACYASHSSLLEFTHLVECRPHSTAGGLRMSCTISAPFQIPTFLLKIPSQSGPHHS